MLEATYIYTDELGRPRLRKTRSHGKRFTMEAARYKSERLYWKAGPGVVERWQGDWAPGALFNLPVLLDALKYGETTFLSEGERCATVLSTLRRLPATTGWQGLEFTSEQAEWFAPTRRRQSDAVIFLDADEPGHWAGWQKYSRLRGVGVSRKRIEMYLPRDPRHKDVTNVALSGLSRNAFVRVAPAVVEDAAERYGAARAARYVRGSGSDAEDIRDWRAEVMPRQQQTPARDTNRGRRGQRHGRSAGTSTGRSRP